MKHRILMMGLCVLMGIALTAQAAERNTAERTGDFVSLTAGGTIDAGHQVMVDTNGLAVAAAVTPSTLKIVGRAENSVVSGETVTVKRGIFRWTAAATYTDSAIGGTAYAHSTNPSYTVNTVGTNSVGKIVDVDASGVWVDNRL
jgi:hypothetical protein